MSKKTKLKDQAPKYSLDDIIGYQDEKDELLEKEPLSKKYIKKYVNAKELISRKHRYCLWLNNADPIEIKQLPTIMKKIEAVKKFRLESSSPDTQRYADYPMRPARLALERILNNKG